MSLNVNMFIPGTDEPLGLPATQAVATGGQHATPAVQSTVPVTAVVEQHPRAPPTVPGSAVVGQHSRAQFGY